MRREEPYPAGRHSVPHPGHTELAERPDAVLEAIYTIYAEGWSDPIGTHARSRGLSEEAIWLGR
ncbi:MAG: hypothetical protein ACREVJ_04215 [Gammaproteobacteria bacterium]